MLAAVATAQAWDAQATRRQPGPFLAGMAAGVLAHEAGHALVATVKGYDIGVQGASIVYPDARMTPSDHLQVASAGIQTQWLLSEYLLRQHEAHPEQPLSPFKAGVVMSHVTISAAYLLVLKDYDTSDLYGIAQETGLTTTELAALIAVPAALDYWRLTGKSVPRWVPMVSAGYKGAGVVAAWTF
jgi:hypothetical protein